jgi:hypothetical protein
MSQSLGGRIATVVLLSFAGPAAAQPVILTETYRDLSTKEALYLTRDETSDTMKVAYRGPRGGDPKPLTVLPPLRRTRDPKSFVQVRFRNSPTVWSLTISDDRQTLRCEAEGEPTQTFTLLTPERVAELRAKGEGDLVGHFVLINSAEEGSASYSPELEVTGVVSEGARKLTVSSFNARGHLRTTEPVDGFSPGARTFAHRLSTASGNVGIGTNKLVFEATFDDGKKVKRSLTISLHQYEGDMGKPVVYLYPPEPTGVRVEVAPKHGVRVSEPPYGDGWTVTAHPDGRLVTPDGRSWPSLFWESGLTQKPEPLTEGFSVPRAQVAAFLQDRLATLGLNERETADFLEFWLPRLTVSEFAMIRFVPAAEIDAMAPLTITPQPDSVLRVLIDFRPGHTAQRLKPQHLTPARRHGFAAVEWGGLIYPP